MVAAVAVAVVVARTAARAVKVLAMPSTAVVVVALARDPVRTQVPRSGRQRFRSVFGATKLRWARFCVLVASPLEATAVKGRLPLAAMTLGRRPLWMR